MATTNLDFRKIDYDQLLDKPITRTSANVDAIKTAGVYDRGDGKRFLVSVDGNTITQIEESYNGYRTRTSTDGGLVRWAWDTVQFSDATHKWDVVVISDNEPAIKRETTAWIDTSNENKFKVYDGTEWLEVSGQSIQTEEMPTASEELEGKIIQYEGATTSTFTHGYFYECVGDGGDPEEFSWVNIKVQDAPGQAETMPVPSAENVGQIIQYAGDTNEYHTHGHFYEVIEDPENPGQYIYKEVEVQNSPAQAEEMPEASEENEGKIIQYQGETDSNFTHGYFYECISDWAVTPTYSREQINVQSAWEEHEFITQAAYDQLTPAQKAEKVYMITGEGGIPVPTDINAEDVDFDNTWTGMQSDNVQDAIEEVFQSVSNGKTLIAAAITDKGVSTAATDSFQTMASNIESIVSAWTYWKTLAVGERSTSGVIQVSEYSGTYSDTDYSIFFNIYRGTQDSTVYSLAWIVYVFDKATQKIYAWYGGWGITRENSRGNLYDSVLDCWDYFTVQSCTDENGSMFGTYWAFKFDKTTKEITFHSSAFDSYATLSPLHNTPKTTTAYNNWRMSWIMNNAAFWITTDPYKNRLYYSATHDTNYNHNFTGSVIELF